MNIKRIVENIFQMENEMELFQKNIGDVHFWKLVRFNVVSQITQAGGIYGQAHTKRKINLKNVFNYNVRAVKNIFLKNPFFVPKCEILFIGHPRRKLMEDGFWWDIYCDPVIDKAEKAHDCLLLEKQYNNTHFSPAKTANIGYLDIAEFLVPLLRRMGLFGLALTPKEEDLLFEIERQIYERFSVRINLKEIIAGELLARKITLPIYTYLIKKIDPKVVFVICSYGKESIIEACKNLSVPVVELQHGNIGRYHVGYSFPESNAIQKRFPDYFLAFGDYWLDQVNLPIPKENIFSVGYPFFEMETAKYAHENKNNQILFISQGTIGKAMSKFAVELKARKDFSLDIIYKLHPGEYGRWKTEYPWLIDSGIKVLDDESIPFYRLLAQSKALVGVYSTAIYEGLGFGLKSFLLDLPGIEYMSELIDSKAVSLISTVDELVKEIRQPNQQHIETNYFFKANALNNICITTAEILHRHKKGDL